MIALRIFQLCANNDIHLDIHRIPRAEVDRADFISRLIDVDDWKITPSCFAELERLWGKHFVDCFANYYDKKINRYFSRFWNPACSGVDFFVQNLPGETCLVMPPVSLVIRALHYLYACRATAGHWWYLSGLQLNSGLYLLEITATLLSNLSYSMEELPNLGV